MIMVNLMVERKREIRIRNPYPRACRKLITMKYI